MKTNRTANRNNFKTYAVTVYKIDEKKPGSIVGTIKPHCSDGMRIFRTVEELKTLIMELYAHEIKKEAAETLMAH